MNNVSLKNHFILTSLSKVRDSYYKPGNRVLQKIPRDKLKGVLI